MLCKPKKASSDYQYFTHPAGWMPLEDPPSLFQPPYQNSQVSATLHKPKCKTLSSHLNHPGMFGRTPSLSHLAEILTFGRRLVKTGTELPFHAFMDRNKAQLQIWFVKHKKCWIDASQRELLKSIFICMARWCRTHIRLPTWAATQILQTNINELQKGEKVESITIADPPPPP